MNDLEWFADLHALEYKRNKGRLRHYHYRTMSKRFGQIRLIESPKTRLKDIQRRILVRHPRPHPAACVGPWLPARPIREDVCSASYRQTGCSTDRSPGFLSVDLGSASSGSLSHGRLPGASRRSACRSLYEFCAYGCLGRRCDRIDTRTNPPGPPAVFQAPSSTGGAHIACASESIGVPDGLPTIGPREFCRCNLHAICRRPGVLGRP